MQPILPGGGQVMNPVLKPEQRGGAQKPQLTATYVASVDVRLSYRAYFKPAQRHMRPLGVQQCIIVMKMLYTSTRDVNDAS